MGDVGQRRSAGEQAEAVRPDPYDEPTGSDGRTAHGSSEAEGSIDDPSDLSARSWLDIAKSVKREVKDDHVTLMSAGVAFYALLALVPGLIALISIYGLVSDPDEVEGQVVRALSAAPAEVRDMLAAQMQDIAAAGGGAVLGVILGVLVALWTASNGVGNLMQALSIAYNVEEKRGWVKRKALALVFTLGAILFFVVAFASFTFLPNLLDGTGLGGFGQWAMRIGAWVVLAAGLLVGLAVLYRYGPNRRPEPRWVWVSPGAVLALVLWIVGSLIFSIYTRNFGNYNETYGSLGAVVVTMLWLFITALAILLGAEVNSETEKRAPNTEEPA